MKKLILVSGFVLLLAPLFGQTITVDTIQSQILEKKVATTIVLPRNYNPKKTYAVFYFLHSWGGSNRMFADMNLTASLDDKPFIVVMPAADSSWYMNSVTDPKRQYEDFMTKELFPYIDGKFKTHKDKQAIGGASMGGYGALYLGLKYPERFRFVADLSGAINVPFYGIPVTPLMEPVMNSVYITFGDTNSVSGKESPIRTLTEQFDHPQKPYIFMAIGRFDEYDFLITAHREYCKLLDEKGFQYEYRELFAGHMTFEVRWAVTPYLFLKMREVLDV